MPYSDPDIARAYQREYRRLRRAGERTTPCQTQLPAGFRLRKAVDVLLLIEEQVETVRRDRAAGVLEKARCIGYLASVALKAIDSGSVAARVEALEAVLKHREKGDR